MHACRVIDIGDLTYGYVLMSSLKHINWYVLNALTHIKCATYTQQLCVVCHVLFSTAKQSDLKHLLAHQMCNFLEYSTVKSALAHSSR